MPASQDTVAYARGVPAIRFVFLGVPIEIRASFLLTFGALGILTHRNVGSLLAFVAISLIAVLAHEAGHAIAFRAFRARPSITVDAGGGETRGGDQGVVPMIIVAAAGPAVGFGVGLAVWLLARLTPPPIAPSPFVDDAILLTVGLSLLHLVPIGRLDGSSILNGLVLVATKRPAGSLGWFAGALAVFAFAVGAVLSGRSEIAVFVLVFVVLNAIDLTSASGSLMALIDLGRTEDAVLRAERTLREDPTHQESLVAHGIGLLELTRWAEAATFYDDVLERMPGNLRALAGRSVARRELGNVRGAASDLNALMATAANGMDDVGAQYVGLYADRQYQRALELVRTELEQPGLSRPEALHLRSLEAALEVVAGYPEEALRHADALIASHFDMVAADETAALALFQLGRFEEGTVRARRALAGGPKHSELLETSAIGERLSGRPEAALELLLRAAPARPDLPRARAELSVCYTQLGRPAEAAAAIDTLPAWSADDPYVLYARACLLSAAGRNHEAGEFLETASQGVPALGWLARVDPLLHRARPTDA